MAERPENIAKGLDDCPPIIDSPKQKREAVSRAAYNRAKISKGMQLDPVNAQWQMIYEATIAKWNKSQAKIEVSEDGSTKVEVNTQNGSIPTSGPPNLPLGSVPAHLFNGKTPLYQMPSDDVLIHDVNGQTNRKVIDAEQAITVKQLETLPRMVEVFTKDKEVILNAQQKDKEALEKHYQEMVAKEEKYFLDLISRYDAADKAKDITIDKLSSIITKQAEQIEKVYSMLGRGLDESDILSARRLVAFKQLIHDIKDGKINAKDETTLGKLASIIKDIKPLLEEAGPVVIPMLGGAIKLLGLPFKIETDK